MLRSSKRFPSFRFPHQNPLCSSSNPTHATCPFRSSWFDHPDNIWSGLEIMKLLIMQSSPFPCFIVHLMPIPLLRRLQLMLIVRGNQRINWERYCEGFKAISLRNRCKQHERA
jgi:hypothetical protein